MNWASPDRIFSRMFNFLFFIFPCCSYFQILVTFLSFLSNFYFFSLILISYLLAILGYIWGSRSLLLTKHSITVSLSLGKMSGAEQTLLGKEAKTALLCCCPSKTVLCRVDKDHQTQGRSFPAFADLGFY